MADTLGILVNTDKYLDYVVNLTRAAHSKGKDVQIFFTGKGVLLTLKPDFKKLVGKARLAICDVSFRSHGLHGREDEVPGVGFKDFATQAKNAEMVANMDRYVVF
ncbi:MAG: DsrE family protein [Desulfobacteraceae bacterium]|nr:DsrE family protein [Desulfobacteraceae bacterium]